MQFPQVSLKTIVGQKHRNRFTVIIPVPNKPLMHTEFWTDDGIHPDNELPPNTKRRRNLSYTTEKSAKKLKTEMDIDVETCDSKPKFSDRPIGFEYCSSSHPLALQFANEVSYMEIDDYFQDLGELPDCFL